jgi:hypothetical protein
MSNEMCYKSSMEEDFNAWRIVVVVEEDMDYLVSRNGRDVGPSIK